MRNPQVIEGFLYELSGLLLLKPQFGVAMDGAAPGAELIGEGQALGA